MKVFAEENEQAEEAIEGFMSKPPLPVSIFSQELTKVMDSNYHFGIHETGKKVVDRLLKQYVKPMADAEIQTESIKEITLKYE